MSISLQPPCLKGKKVYTIPLDPAHFESLYAVASDPLVWEQHPNPNRYQRDVFQTYFEGAMESKGALLVLDKPTNLVVGCIRFYAYNKEQKSILIGYTFIGRTYWGKGYNADLKQLMLDYIFQYVDTVYFHVGAENIRSQKAMVKIGAKKIDEIQVAYYGEAEKTNFVYQIHRPNPIS